MKDQHPKKSARPPSRRKNISLHPDVQKMLTDLAESEYTTASALLTQLILARAERLKTSAPLSQAQEQKSSLASLPDAKKTARKKAN